MGAAAENRFKRLVRRQADQAARLPEFEFMDDLNALPKYPDAGKPFGPINFVSGHGGWWAECPSTGFGYWYSTLREAVRRWRVTIMTYDAGTLTWGAVTSAEQRGVE